MTKLTYWPKRGRGEQVRLLLSELGEPWEDVFVSPQDGSFQALQRKGPSHLWFGSIPMIEVDGFRLVQGPAILGWLARRAEMLPPDDLEAWARADAMVLGAEDLRSIYLGFWGPDDGPRRAAFVAGPWRERWRPAFEGLLGLGGDTGFFVGGRISHADVAVFDALDAVLQWVEGANLDGAPRLQAFMHEVASRPRIAAYLASERRASG